MKGKFLSGGRSVGSGKMPSRQDLANLQLVLAHSLSIFSPFHLEFKKNI